MVTRILNLLVVCSIVSDAMLNEVQLTDSMLFWKRSNKEKCEPFTTYAVECNSCVCSADGTAYCTKYPCLKPDLKKLFHINDVDMEDMLND